MNSLRAWHWPSQADRRWRCLGLVDNTAAGKGCRTGARVRRMFTAVAVIALAGFAASRAGCAAAIQSAAAVFAKRTSFSASTTVLSRHAGRRIPNELLLA